MFTSHTNTMQVLFFVSNEDLEANTFGDSLNNLHLLTGDVPVRVVNAQDEPALAESLGMGDESMLTLMCENLMLAVESCSSFSSIGRFLCQFSMWQKRFSGMDTQALAS